MDDIFLLYLLPRVDKSEGDSVTISSEPSPLNDRSSSNLVHELQWVLCGLVTSSTLISLLLNRQYYLNFYLDSNIFVHNNYGGSLLHTVSINIAHDQ